MHRRRSAGSLDLVSGELSLQRLRGQPLRLCLCTKFPHCLEQKILTWLGSEDTADYTAHGFPLTLIRESDRGLGFHGNNDVDGVPMCASYRSIIQDDTRPTY